MNALTFFHFVSNQPRNKKLLARIALNACGYASEFPVGVIELRHLSPIQCGAVNAFLDWSKLERNYVVTGVHRTQLTRFAGGDYVSLILAEYSSSIDVHSKPLLA